MIVSPCISICKSDPITNLCYVCARNSDERIKWKNKNTSDNWKLNNLIEIKSRMNGWQLTSFKNHIIISASSEFL